MRAFAVVALFVATSFSASCTQSQPPPAAAPTAASAPFSNTLDVKQLMNWVMDANASAVFAAVGTIVTEKGEEHIAPKTDEQWTAVRNSAAVVLESGNLLMLPERAKDQDQWMQRAQAMSAAADEVLRAIDVKDSESLFTAAGDLYQACSDCHAAYIFAGDAAPDSKQ